MARAVVDDRTGDVVGHAGFHGAPEDGVLSVGCTVLPAHRGRGYARAALLLLVAEARRTSGVTTVRATFSPDNASSLGVVVCAGSTLAGEHLDEIDGLELVHDLDVSERSAPA